MKKYLKLKKVSFKNIDKFFISLMDKPVFDKGLVLPDKLPDKLIVSTRVSPGWPALLYNLYFDSFLLICTSCC